MERAIYNVVLGFGSRVRLTVLITDGRLHQMAGSTNCGFEEAPYYSDDMHSSQDDNKLEGTPFFQKSAFEAWWTRH